MTYADDVVMWTWVLALVGTLVGLALAWRGLARADVEVARARQGTESLTEVVEAVRALDGATREAAGERVRLHTRASGP